MVAALHDMTTSVQEGWREVSGVKESSVGITIKRNGYRD